jgi:hypothetical protein
MFGNDSDKGAQIDLVTRSLWTTCSLNTNTKFGKLWIDVRLRTNALFIHSMFYAIFSFPQNLFCYNPQNSQNVYVFMTFPENG